MSLSNGKKRVKRPTKSGKLGHGRVSPDEVTLKPIDSVRPSPENEKLYRPVSESDPEICALAASISEFGIKEPLLATLDGILISGHRRLCAAGLAGLTHVPVRIEPIYSTDPKFLRLLREANRQRVKTLAEVTREQVLDADPEEAYRLIVEHRKRQSRLNGENFIDIVGIKHRCKITEAKRPFLDAIILILKERRDFWPLSVRQIHYVLLNAPPLIHASKRNSRHANNKESYKSAIDLIARGRLAGEIPWDSIDDETRPITTWSVYPSVAPFMRRELEDFLKGYYRDLQQSQPNQFEIVGEKNTIASIIKPVAAHYCIPFTIGRGYSSLPPRYKMAQRFQQSGKDNLIIFVLNDHDPEGNDIPHSFVRSMRDDFGIKNVEAIRVALTPQHVEQFGLQPNNLENKKKGSRYKQFVEKYCNEGYELEAMQPADLQRTLHGAIDSVLDVKAFNAEIDAEKREVAHLLTVRRAVQTQLAQVKFE